MVKVIMNYELRIMKMVLLLVTAMVCCFSVAAFGAGGDLVWEFGDTPNAGKQEALSMLVDSGGNTIIAGFSAQSGTDDYYIVKIKADGSGIAWKKVYDVAGGNDYATAVALDSADNVIITGYTWNGTNYDFHTIKYNGSDGAVLWQHSFNADTMGDDYNTTVAVDSLNNVYIGGNSQSGSGIDDIIIIKYGPNGPNPDGTPIWQTSYNGSANRHDRITSITAGPDGIAVTGLSENSTPDYDALTLKYGFDGSFKWEKRKSLNGYDRGEVVRMDSLGNVIMTGSLYNGSNKDIYIVKYASATGNVLWEDTFDGGYDEEPKALFIDSLGDVYITGYTFVLSSDNDLYTAKYNGSTGVREWDDVVNSFGGNNDRGVGIVLDESGGVFVTGDSYDELAENYNFQTLKYTKSDGNLLWQKIFDRSTGKGDRPVGVGIGLSGAVITAGWSNSSITDTQDQDFYAVQYDSGLLNPPTNLAAAASSTSEIALSWNDNSSNEDGFRIERKIGDFGIYAEIVTVGPDIKAYNDAGLNADTKYFYRIKSYNSGDGDSYYSNEVYAITTIFSFDSPTVIYTYTGPSQGDDRVNAVAVGSDYNPVVTGYSYSLAGQFDYYTLKLNRSDLGLVWNVRYDSDQNDMDMAVTILSDSNNDVVISGSSCLFSVESGSNTNDIYTIKYPSTGPPEDWNDQYNGPAGDDDRSSIVDVSVNGSDDYVVLGYGRNADWNDDIYVIKYLSDGTREWEADPYDGGVMGHDYPSAAAFDSSGDIIIAGYTYNGTDYDFLTRKYSGTDGSVIWTDKYNVAGTGNDYLRSIAIDLYGNIYVTGLAVTASGNEDFYTIKYDTTNGTRLWERSFNGIADGIDEAIGIKLDPVNNQLLVGGTTLAGPDNNEMHIIRYDMDGNVIWERTLDRPDDNDFASAIDVDPSGTVHIAGETDSGSYTDMISAQYSGDGSFLGGAVYDGAAGGGDGATSVAVNSLGEAFVGGYTSNANGNSDYIVYKVTNNLLQAPVPFIVTPVYEDANLEWADNTITEDGFHLERITGSCSSGNPWVLIYTASAGETVYSDTNLSIDADYCYRVRTFKNNGETSRWVQREITTYVPTAPVDLSATVVNTSRIDLLWTDTTIGEEGYRIERCAGVDCSDFAEIAVVSPNVTTYIDNTGCNTTSYSYRVKAFKTGRWNTGYSNIATAVTATMLIPSGIAAERISETEISVSINNYFGDETGFEIQRCSGETASCIQDADYTESLLVTPPYITSPVMILRMDESRWSGTNGAIKDSSGSGNNGTAFNGVNTIEEAYAGRAGNFDGVDDYIYLTDSALDTLSDLTIEFRAKTLGSGDGIIAGVNDDDGSEFMLYDQSSLVIRMKEIDWNSGVSFNDGNWHHIAVVRSGSSVKVYKDGVLENSTDTAASGPIQIKSNGLILGQKYYYEEESMVVEDAYEGLMDEFAVYEYALENSDVQEHFNNGVPPGRLIYNDTSVVYSTTYTYRSRFFKNYECSWESDFGSSVSANASISAPGILTAIGKDTTRVNLTWIDNTVSEDGFRIERCLAASCNYTEIGTVGPDVTSYSDTSACEHTSYKYRIRAFRTSEWESPYSNEAPAATSAFSDPTNLAATTVSESRIDISWNDNMEDETGYELQRCTGDAAACTTDDDFSYSTNMESMSLDSVLYYKMDEFAWNGTPDEVIDSSGDGRHGTAVEGANTVTEGKRNRAGYFDGTDDYISTPLNIDQGGSKAYTFEAWVYPTSTSDGRHHVIGTDNGGYDWSLLREGGNWFVFTGSDSWDTGIAVTLEQWQHITVVFEPGEGIRFYKDGATPANTTTIGFDTGDNNLNIGRNPGSGEYFAGRIDEVFIYEIALSTEQVQNRYEAGVSGGLNYSDTGLNAGTDYTYRIRAYKSSACSWESGFSNSDDATTITPPAPDNLEAIVVNTTQINLSWSDNTDSETGFRIQRCTGTGCDFSSVDEFTVSTNVSSFIDDTVCDDITYRYRIRAEKDIIPTYETAWTPSTPDVTTPLSVAPSDFTATTVTETQIDLKWIDNTDDESGFRIERCAGIDCNNFELIYTLLNTELDTSEGNVLLMQMEESEWNGTSGEVIDITAFANNGTALNGAVTIEEGRKGRAGSFIGGNSHVEVPDSESLDITVALTIEAWVRLDAYPTEWNLVAMKGDTKSSRAYGMWIRNTGDVLISYNNGGWYHLYPTGQGFTIGEWHHVVGIIDTVTDYRAIYIDGVLKASSSSAIPPLKANNSSLYIGSRNGTWPSDGSIDELAIYNRAMSEEEVLSQFNNIDFSSYEYSDTGLTFGETYSYRVNTFKDADCGWSTAYTDVVKSTVEPPAPGDFTATPVSTTQIDLSWSDMTDGEDGFKIERCIGADCTDFTPFAITGKDVINYSDTTVCENTIYRYVVYGYTELDWETDYSTIAEAATFPKAAPSDLSAVRVSEVQIDLSWEDNSMAESGFVIERCIGDICTDFTELAIVEQDTTSHSDSGITSQTSYKYRIKAFKDADCSWVSDYANSVAVVTSLGEPDSLTAIAINTTDVSLSWNDNTSSESGFSIERCMGAECTNFTEIAVTESEVSFFTDTSACNSTMYNYRVRSRNDDDLSKSGGGCWTRKMPLEITDFVRYYQTEITIPYDPDMKSDFGDIRFYDITTGSERPYWIESKTDGVSVTVYMKTFGVNDLYMLYGNPSTESVSSAADTFDLYDPADEGLLSAFTKSESNPVLGLGTANSWDDAHIYGMSVMKDDGIYKIWYSGSDGVYFRIGYATSADGKTWTRHESNPVIDLGLRGAWDDYHVAYPHVIKDNGIYRMWYAGYDSSKWRVGYAVSNDGVNWTKYDSNPVLDTGSGGSWDDVHVIPGTIIRESENLFKMWYTGHDGGKYRIGYATSGNGKTWLKHGSNPVLSTEAAGTWESDHVYLPMVMKEENNEYKMWYTGHDSANTRIGYASSDNGTSWTKFASNPVLDIGDKDTWDDVHVYNPYILKNSDGVYEMWYAGHNGSNWRTGYASVRPQNNSAITPTVNLGTEEQSACFTFDSWDTGYSEEASAATLNPGVPSDLLTTALTDTISELTWTYNSLDETGFVIERCEGVDCTGFEEIDIAVPGVESYSDTTLSPALTYCYRVKAYKDSICGWDTGYTNVSCDISYSTAPTELTATALNSLTISLAWIDNSTDEDGYELEKRLFNGTFLKIATLAPGETAFTDTMGIEPDKEYHFRVRGFRGDDKSPYSNIASVTTPAWQEVDDTCP